MGRVEPWNQCKQVRLSNPGPLQMAMAETSRHHAIQQHIGTVDQPVASHLTADLYPNAYSFPGWLKRRLKELQ